MIGDIWSLWPSQYPHSHLVPGMCNWIFSIIFIHPVHSLIIPISPSLLCFIGFHHPIPPTLHPSLNYMTLTGHWSPYQVVYKTCSVLIKATSLGVRASGQDYHWTEELKVECNWLDYQYTISLCRISQQWLANCGQAGKSTTQLKDYYRTITIVTLSDGC